MDTRRLSTALPALCLCFAPLLMAAECPRGLLGGQPHHGDWVADVDDGVIFYRFGSSGDTIMTVEVYSRSILFDEMKLEVHAECARVEGEEPEADGTYTLHCVDERAVRGSEGLGATFGALYAFGDALGAPGGTTGVLKVRRVGARLEITDVPREKRKRAKTRMFEPVERSRSGPFLERFREGTIAIPDTSRPARQKDLP
jgi:hypothetical protein